MKSDQRCNNDPKSIKLKWQVHSTKGLSLDLSMWEIGLNRLKACRHYQKTGDKLLLMNSEHITSRAPIVCKDFANVVQGIFRNAFEEYNKN